MQITSKGQVTIPHEIRNRLGLLPHAKRGRIARGRPSGLLFLLQRLALRPDRTGSEGQLPARVG